MLVRSQTIQECRCFYNFHVISVILNKPNMGGYGRYLFLLLLFAVVLTETQTLKYDGKLNCIYL